MIADNSEEVLMDVDSKSKEEILDFLKKILGKPQYEFKLLSNISINQVYIYDIFF